MLSWGKTWLSETLKSDGLQSWSTGELVQVWIESHPEAMNNDGLFIHSFDHSFVSQRFMKCLLHVRHVWGKTLMNKMQSLPSSGPLSGWRGKNRTKERKKGWGRKGGNKEGKKKKETLLFNIGPKAIKQWWHENYILLSEFTTIKTCSLAPKTCFLHNAPKTIKQ